jgi:hypothetical protein
MGRGRHRTARTLDRGRRLVGVAAGSVRTGAPRLLAPAHLWGLSPRLPALLRGTAAPTL